MRAAVAVAGLGVLAAVAGVAMAGAKGGGTTTPAGPKAVKSRPPVPPLPPPPSPGEPVKWAKWTPAGVVYFEAPAPAGDPWEDVPYMEERRTRSRGGTPLVDADGALKKWLSDGHKTLVEVKDGAMGYYGSGEWAVKSGAYYITPRGATSNLWATVFYGPSPAYVPVPGLQFPQSASAPLAYLRPR